MTDRNNPMSPAAGTSAGASVPINGVVSGGAASAAIVSGGDDIVVSSGAPRNSRRGWLIGVIIALAVAVIGGVIAAVVASGAFNNKEAVGRTANEATLALMSEWYIKLPNVQSNFIYAQRGMFNSYESFGETSKEALDGFRETIADFLTGAEKIKVNDIPNESVREQFAKLKITVAGDWETYYNPTLDLYDLFYAYINSGFDQQYAESIQDLNNTAASAMLTMLDLTAAETGATTYPTLIQELFMVYAASNWPEINYYDYMGNIIGNVREELKDA